MENKITERVEGAMSELFMAIPLVTGSLLASLDGRVIAAHMPHDQQASTAAITASSFALGKRLSGLTGSEDLRALVVNSPTGYVAIYAVGTSMTMIVTAKAGINLGLLNLKARSVIVELEAFLGEAARAS